MSCYQPLFSFEVGHQGRQRLLQAIAVDEGITTQQKFLNALIVIGHACRILHTVTRERHPVTIIA